MPRVFLVPSTILYRVRPTVVSTRSEERILIKWIDFGRLADAATKAKWGSMLGY